MRAIASPLSETAPARAASVDVPARGACVACGEPRDGAFCGACGQSARGRLTTEYLFRRVVTEAVGVDRGLFYTFRALLRDPARVVSDYAAGRTVCYTNPAAFLLLCASIAALASGGSPVPEDVVTGFNEGLAVTSNLPAVHTMRRLAAHTSAMFAFLVPVAAAISCSAFARAGKNYAEHLVFNAYVLGQAAVITAALGVLGGLVAKTGAAPMGVGMLVTMLVMLACYARAAVPLFGERPINGLLTCAGVLAVALALYGMMLGVLSAVLSAFPG